jgi:hypothetical protein
MAAWTNRDEIQFDNSHLWSRQGQPVDGSGWTIEYFDKGIV